MDDGLPVPQPWDYRKIDIRGKIKMVFSAFVYEARGCCMEIEIDKKKVDEAVLALMYLTTFKDRIGWRAWKTHDWDSLDRLHQKGYISNPATKAKSIALTEEAVKRSRDLFAKHFAK
jgi:hypothetical protein